MNILAQTPSDGELKEATRIEQNDQPRLGVWSKTALVTEGAVLSRLLPYSSCGPTPLAAHKGGAIYFQYESKGSGPALFHPYDKQVCHKTVNLA